MNSKNTKILVVGDCILDQYLWTTVSRISPEAPVPICHVQDTTYRLGGAGNVANNLSAFGVDVLISGIIGRDGNGETLEKEFNRSKINTELLIKSNECPTICKSRVLAKNQQLCRLDYEDASRNLENDRSNCLEKISPYFSEIDCLIISDYKKGVVSEHFSQSVIQSAKEHNIPVIVDPKGQQISKYSGATFLTPNMSEFKLFTDLSEDYDDKEIIDNARQLINQFNIDNILLTRSEKGISIISNDRHNNYPTRAKEVADVTGAGDTVVAAIAYGVSQNWDIEDAINFANSAAGVVVSKVGTATASLDEIKDYEQNL